MVEGEKIHDPKKAFSVKKSLKKVWHFLWEEESVASYVAFIVIAFVVLRFLFFPAVLLVTGYSDVAAVVSSSMHHDSLTEHTFYDWLEFNGFNRSEVESWPYLDGLNVGDVIAVKKVPPEDIHVGDIILFYSNRGQIIHRVVFIKKVGNDYYYTTKGDANPAVMSIEKEIPYDEVKGKLVARIPYLGWPKVIFSKIIPI
ncbi:MAG: signal peptidase I [Nanoarchaeota archaeon]|nr:signal peptidase I [Nanoarchaeota archaeon]